MAATQIFLVVLAGTTAFMWPIYAADKYGWSGLTVFLLISISMGACALVADYVLDHQPRETVYTLPVNEFSCTSTYETQQFTGKMWVTVTKCSQYSIDPKGKE